MMMLNKSHQEKQEPFFIKYTTQFGEHHKILSGKLMISAFIQL